MNKTAYLSLSEVEQIQKEAAKHKGWSYNLHLAIGYHPEWDEYLRDYPFSSWPEERKPRGLEYYEDYALLAKLESGAFLYYPDGIGGYYIYSMPRDRVQIEHGPFTKFFFTIHWWDNGGFCEKPTPFVGVFGDYSYELATLLYMNGHMPTLFDPEWRSKGAHREKREWPFHPPRPCLLAESIPEWHPHRVMPALSFPTFHPDYFRFMRLVMDCFPELPENYMSHYLP